MSFVSLGDPAHDPEVLQNIVINPQGTKAIWMILDIVEAHRKNFPNQPICLSVVCNSSELLDHFSCGDIPLRVLT